MFKINQVIIKNMIQKVVNKIKIKNEINNDIEYWLTKSEGDRISAVQELRMQYIKLFNKQKEYNESRERLRRVYRVIKQTRG